MAKFDFGGAATGAASGAAIGSAIPVIGSGIGAVAGGLLGAFGRRKRKPKKIPTFDTTQQQIYNDYSKGVSGEGGPFGSLFEFNPEQVRDVFNKNYAQPAYQQYQEEVIPAITGQFRGGNLQNSSYLGGALAKAGTNVQKNLDAQLANMLYQGQQDSVSRRINAINNILNMQTFAYKKPQPSSTDQFFNTLNDVGGKAFGSYIDRRFGQNPNGSNISTAGGG